MSVQGVGLTVGRQRSEYAPEEMVVMCSCAKIASVKYSVARGCDLANVPGWIFTGHNGWTCGEAGHREIRVGERVRLSISSDGLAGTAEVTKVTEEVVWLKWIEVTHRDGYKLRSGLGTGVGIDQMARGEVTMAHLPEGSVGA